MVDGREACERLRTWGEEPGSVALLTDIDGTLAPIVPTPDMSEISDEIRGSLERLSRRCLLVAAISGRKTEDALGLLEQFANRVVLCKDVGHGHLLERPQDQSGGRGGEGHPQEGGRGDLVHLPYHPQTLAEDEQRRQGPLTGGLHGKETAHPRHSR